MITIDTAPLPNLLGFAALGCYIATLLPTSLRIAYKDAFSPQFDPDPVGAIAEEIVATLKPENVILVETPIIKN
jgi:hypothetical protein